MFLKITKHSKGISKITDTTNQKTRLIMTIMLSDIDFVNFQIRELLNDNLTN